MRTRNNRGSLRRALGAAAVAAAGVAASGFVTQSPLSFWPVGNVEWQVRLLPDGGNVPNPPLQDGSAAWDDAFQVAVDAWNAVLPDNVLTLSTVKGSSAVPGSSDGVNNVGFSNTVYGMAWGGSTLGISISISSGNKRVENDVLFNSTKKWNAYTGNLQFSGGQAIGDLRRVALHELGHSLGLHHPDEFGQVVSAIMNSVTSNLDALVQDDIDGILSLYGAIRPVTITKQPQSISAPAGTSAGFQVEVTGSENITYDWQQSSNGGASFSSLGPTSFGFNFPSVSLGQNGRQYRVVVTNPAGSVTSSAAILTVTAGPEAPAFTTQPASVAVSEGANAVFTVAATGSPTPALQWQFSSNGGASFGNVGEGVLGTGTTSASLTVASVSAMMNGYQFRCMANSSAGMVNSTAATLTVTGGSPPGAPVSNAGAIAAYNAFTAGWQAVAGATGYRLDVATDAGFSAFVSGYQDRDVGNVVSFDIGDLVGGTYYYRVRAYNGNGSGVSSNIVTITIGGRMVNLSTRGQTSTGDAVIIAGFVVGGSQPKQLLIRAVGPTLAAPPFNLGGTVADPRLKLQRLVGGAVVSETSYDNWNSGDGALVNAMAAVGAFPLVAGSLDAATLVTVEPGSYTAQVETVSGVPGIAIVEVYETDSVGSLVNISTRGFVGLGDAIIIPGTVAADGPKRLLVRAVGETIGKPPFNLGGVLEDPVLEVYPSSPPGAPALFSNDDWETNANAAEIATVSGQVGAFPVGAGSKDAVLLIILQSGGYTFQVRGKNGATGLAIVEIYAAP